MYNYGISRINPQNASPKAVGASLGPERIGKRSVRGPRLAPSAHKPADCIDQPAGVACGLPD
jgi:hypothetical protein